jgi:hypothetical protein
VGEWGKRERKTEGEREREKEILKRAGKQLEKTRNIIDSRPIIQW